MSERGKREQEEGGKEGEREKEAATSMSFSFEAGNSLSLSLSHLSDVSVSLPQISYDDTNWVSENISTKTLDLFTKRRTEQES